MSQPLCLEWHTECPACRLAAGNGVHDRLEPSETQACCFCGYTTSAGVARKADTPADAERVQRFCPDKRQPQ